MPLHGATATRLLLDASRAVVHLVSLVGTRADDSNRRRTFISGCRMRRGRLDRSSTRSTVTEKSLARQGRYQHRCPRRLWHRSRIARQGTETRLAGLTLQCLLAYHLEALVPSSATQQVRAAPQRLSQGKDIVFFSVGQVSGRTLILYMRRKGVSPNTSRSLKSGGLAVSSSRTHLGPQCRREAATTVRSAVWSEVRLVPPLQGFLHPDRGVQRPLFEIQIGRGLRQRV